MTSVHKGSTKRKRGILDCFNAPKSNVDDHAVGNAPAVLVQVDVHQVDVPVHAQPGGDGLVLPPSLTSPSEITEILVDQPAVNDGSDYDDHRPPPHPSTNGNEHLRQRPSIAKAFRSLGTLSSPGCRINSVDNSMACRLCRQQRSERYG